MRRAGGDGAPHIVLLTPGPYNETYFEHAYLARYLGLPLVEGGDLTVRDDRVFLQDASPACEPRARDPARGWTTTSAIRSSCAPTRRSACPAWCRRCAPGNVLVANALGSGVLESPALHGFLPAISRRLLGEELVLPSLPPGGAARRAAWAAVRREPAGSRAASGLRRIADRGDGARLIAADEPAELAARIDADPTPTRCRTTSRCRARRCSRPTAICAAAGDAARLRGRRRRTSAGTCCRAA